MPFDSFQLLKTLTDAPGVSGFETPIRRLLKEYLAPLSTQVENDHIGSLIAIRQTSEEHPKIMLVAHQDEVGFMVTQITDQGFIRFQQLGGWWSQVLLDQKVEILTQKGTVMGVVGAKAPHGLSAEEMAQAVKLSTMFIDIGATSKQEAEDSSVAPGDPIVPVSSFEVCCNQKSFMCKALDDRAGCAMIIECFDRLNELKHPGTVYGVMTVQEEVGTRGAATSVSVVRPDVAIVLDVTIAFDTPNVTDAEAITRTSLGKGPVVAFYDASMIPHLALRDLVVDLAKKNNIPYQVEIMPGGGTDAGRIHLFRQGVPSIVIGIPVRYIHDHIGIAHIDDYKQSVELIMAVIQALDKKTVENLNQLD